MGQNRRADSRLRLPTSAVYSLNSLNGQLLLFYTPHTPCLSGRRCTVGWLCALCRYSVPSSSERRQGPLWRFLKESAPSAQADLMYHAEPPLRRGHSARLSRCISRHLPADLKSQERSGKASICQTPLQSRSTGTWHVHELTNLLPDPGVGLHKTEKNLTYKRNSTSLLGDKSQ